MSDSPKVLNAIEEQRPRRYRVWVTGLAVVLAIGVLIAIVLPTFSDSVEMAQDKPAQRSLRNALVAAHICFKDQDTYQSCGAPALVGIEPSLAYVDGSMSSDDPWIVSVAISDQSSASTGIGMAAWSKNERCFYLQETGLAEDSAAEVLEKRLASLEKKRSQAQSEFVKAKPLSNRATVALGRMNTFLEQIAVIRSQLVVLEGIPLGVGANYGVAEDSDGTDCFGKDAFDRATEATW